MKRQQKTDGLVLFLCMFFCVNVAAQTKTEGYKIDYRVYLSGSDSTTAELQGAMVFWNETEPFIRAYVTTKKIRVEQNDRMPYVQIVNFIDGTSFKYWSQTDSTKIVQERDVLKPQISFDPFSEEPYVDAMILTLTDNTQVIAGYTCSLARFSFGKNVEFLVWYVKDLPRLFFGKHDFLKKIPGLPLKITVSTKDTDFEFGIMATSVEKLEIDTSLFDVPENDAQPTDILANADLNNLPYPDLIPVLKDGLFGYCDRNLNMIIEPQFYRAGFFETDFSFQMNNVNNPNIVRYGSDDYAWVETGDNKRYRIDKKGNMIYPYDEADFKTDATFISLNESEGFKVTGVDKTTLFQIINNTLTVVDSTFFDVTRIDTLKPKNPGGKADMLIICYPHKKDLPLGFFRDEKTQLQGLKNLKTGQVVVEPKYTMLDPFFNGSMKLKWYPMLRAYSPAVNSSFYIGLDGKEYIIE